MPRFTYFRVTAVPETALPLRTHCNFLPPRAKDISGLHFLLNSQLSVYSNYESPMSGSDDGITSNA
jgi:hypothetical protein